MELTKGAKISILKSLEEKNIKLNHAQILFKSGIVGFVFLDGSKESEKHLEALIKYGINPFLILKSK